MTETIEIIKLDDWHVHFRYNEVLKAVVSETTRYFSRAIAMPNLKSPILNGQDGIQYKKRIEKSMPIYITYIIDVTISCFLLVFFFK